MLYVGSYTASPTLPIGLGTKSKVSFGSQRSCSDCAVDALISIDTAYIYLGCIPSLPLYCHHGVGVFVGLASDDTIEKHHDSLGGASVTQLPGCPASGLIGETSQQSLE